MATSIRIATPRPTCPPIGLAKAQDEPAGQTQATIGEQWAQAGRSANGTMLESSAARMLSLAGQLRCAASANEHLGSSGESALEQASQRLRTKLDMANLVPGEARQWAADVGIALKAQQNAHQNRLDMLRIWNPDDIDKHGGEHKGGDVSPSPPPSPPPPPAPAAKQDSSLSDWALFDNLSKTIGEAKSDLVDPYGDIVKGLTDYFGNISELMSKLSDWVKAGKDSSHMSVNAKAIYDALDDLIWKYSQTDREGYPQTAKVAIVVLDCPDGMTPAEFREKWQKELGDALDVVSAANRNWVCVNVDKLRQMRDSLYDHRYDSDWEPNTAQYQAWNTGFSGEKDGIQNDVQTLVEKYSRLNSTFDNMVKILSATMQAMLETEKAYLRI